MQPQKENAWPLRIGNGLSRCLAHGGREAARKLMVLHRADPKNVRAIRRSGWPKTYGLDSWLPKLHHFIAIIIQSPLDWHQPQTVHAAPLISDVAVFGLVFSYFFFPLSHDVRDFHAFAISTRLRALAILTYMRSVVRKRKYYAARRNSPRFCSFRNQKLLR